MGPRNDQLPLRFAESSRHELMVQVSRMPNYIVLVFLSGITLWSQPSDRDRTREVVRPTVQRNLERLNRGGFRNTRQYSDSKSGIWKGLDAGGADNGDKLIYDAEYGDGRTYITKIQLKKSGTRLMTSFSIERGSRGMVFAGKQEWKDSAGSEYKPTIAIAIQETDFAQGFGYRFLVKGKADTEVSCTMTFQANVSDHTRDTRRLRCVTHFLDDPWPDKEELYYWTPIPGMK